MLGKVFENDLRAINGSEDGMIVHNQRVTIVGGPFAGTSGTTERLVQGRGPSLIPLWIVDIPDDDATDMARNHVTRTITGLLVDGDDARYVLIEAERRLARQT